MVTKKIQKKPSVLKRPLIQIGGDTNRIESARNAIISVLEAVRNLDFGDAVAIEAISVLGTAADASGQLNVTGCTFKIGEYEESKEG